MSVLRACMHDFTLKDGITDTRLQGELAGTYAFVEDVDRFYPAAYSEEEPRLSLNGVSTHLKVTDADDSRFVLAQHLMATPNQERDFPVAYAVPSLAATRLHKDAWVALRPIPDETRFDVTLVSRDELLDTMELRV